MKIALAKKFKSIGHDFIEEADKDRGRLEIGRYWITGELTSLSAVSEWKGLRSIGMVERECWQDDKKTIEKCFFINSITADAKKFSQAVRGHWGAENPLHWRLGVVFGDDTSNIQKTMAMQS